MSYSIKKEGDKFCVYDEKGKSKGEFDNRHDAVAKMRSLYKAEGQSEKKNPKADTQDSSAAEEDMEE